MTAETLAIAVQRLFEDPTALVKAATSAHALANYHAVDHLAELIEELAEKQVSAGNAAITA
jgi:UDP-N-acetylglucosamine--N-acetylmuramyl-(pentapeptide) pyrophosphoryl-undecaprenol N-acetylglucosamine transferase